MNKTEFIDDLITELAYRTHSGIPDLANGQHITLLGEILAEWGMGEIGDELIQYLTEADKNEDDKDYTHKAYGYFVRTTEKDKEDAQIYRRDDNGKYIPVDRDEYDEKAKEQGELGSTTQGGGDADDSSAETNSAADVRGSSLNPSTDAGKEYVQNLPVGDPARRNPIVYPIGGGYYSDTPDGEPMYKKVEETTYITEQNIKLVDTPGKTDIKVTPVTDKERKDVKKKLDDTSEIGGISYNIPENQVNYYKEVARASTERITSDFSKSERTLPLRILYSKLQLISMGDDVELDDNDILNLSNLVISGNPASGEIYDSTLGISGKQHGIRSVSEKSPNYPNRNMDKNILMNKWDTVVKYMNDKGVPLNLRPKFKVGIGSLSDSPPNLNHNPINMKPSRLLNSMQKTSVNKLLESDVINSIEKSSGIIIENDEFFGVRLDVNNPKTFLKNIELINNSISTYIDESNSTNTKSYFDKFTNGLNRILRDGTLADDTKLKNINEKLPQLFSELYNDSLKLSQAESRNILKDFSEIVVYINGLSQKQELYMPVSGNYPLADIVEISRDGQGNAINIEGVSIKSKKGTETTPGSSAKEFLKHFSNVYSEHKSILSSIESLQVNSIDNVDMDIISDSEVKKDVDDIRSLNSMNSWDDAKNICNRLGLDWGSVYTSLKKTHYPKYKNELQFTPEGMANVVKELVFRKYTSAKTLNVLDNLKLPTNLKFVNVVVNTDDITINLKSENSTTSEFMVHDKGYLSYANVIKDPPPPRVGPLKYLTGNIALRLK